MHLHATCASSVSFSQALTVGRQVSESPSPAQDGWGGVMGGNVHGTGEHRSDQVLGETRRDAYLADQRQCERHTEFGADECQDQCHSESKFLKVR